MLCRPEFNIVFPNGQWHLLLAGKPLSYWMKEWLDRDYYRFVLSKIRNVEEWNDDLREVQYQGECASGLTFAWVYSSWAFSFPHKNSPWINPTVSAQEVRIDSNGNLVESECEIQHISCKHHVDHWSAALRDWGRNVANSCKIAVVSGYEIHMYPAPREHGNPHVHIVQGAEKRTIAKYRVDVYECMEGRLPHLDTLMREWIENNRESLLQSWARCRSGAHPYKIE